MRFVPWIRNMLSWGFQPRATDSEPVSIRSFLVKFTFQGKPWTWYPWFFVTKNDPKKWQICGDSKSWECSIWCPNFLLQNPSSFLNMQSSFSPTFNQKHNKPPWGINPENLRPLLLTTIRSFNGYLLHSGERVCASKSHDDWDSWCCERNKNTTGKNRDLNCGGASVLNLPS